MTGDGADDGPAETDGPGDVDGPADDGAAGTDDDAPSVAARDDLAGVVDLFGALTRAELSDALSELAFKRRAEADEAAVDAAIDVALAEYYLVPVPGEAVSGEGSAAGDADSAAPPDAAGADAAADLLAVGPAAFPSLPPKAEDLPHILDVPDREVDRERLAAATLDRLTDDVDAAVDAGDADRLEALLDVAYDAEAWAPVETDDLRDRIVAALD